MVNNRAAGAAELGFTLVISPEEREALEAAAYTGGTSVANYVRSYVPELEVRKKGRPRKGKAASPPRRARKTQQKRRKSKVSYF